MKSFVITLAFIVGLVACQSTDAGKKMLQTKALDTANFTSIKWVDSLKDIGNVPAGKTAEISFRVLNTGRKPLLVITVQPGCGCTVADYPKEAILPGREGIIKAGYNVHKDGHGDFKKNIRVTTNTTNKTDNYIFFYGTIIPDSTTSSKK